MLLLKKRGTDDKVGKIVHDLYSNNKMKFNLRNVGTEWIDDSGVRQGCILFTRMRRAEVAIAVGSRMLGCLGYADDLVIMAESGEDMDRLLEIVSDYGKEWEVSFNTRKCKLMEHNAAEGQ